MLKTTSTLNLQHVCVDLLQMLVWAWRGRQSANYEVCTQPEMFDCSRFQTETEMLPPEFIPADVLQLLVFLINHRCRFNPGLNRVNAGLHFVFQQPSDIQTFSFCSPVTATKWWIRVFPPGSAARTLKRFCLPKRRRRWDKAHFTAVIASHYGGRRMIMFINPESKQAAWWPSLCFSSTRAAPPGRQEACCRHQTLHRTAWVSPPHVHECLLHFILQVTGNAKLNPTCSFIHLFFFYLEPGAVCPWCQHVFLSHFYDLGMISSSLAPINVRIRCDLIKTISRWRSSKFTGRCQGW